MKMTIADIAKEVGVSKSTISRYLNGGYVSEEKREIIQKVIDKHEYRPNINAQSIKGESSIIGVVLPRINSFSAQRVIEGIIEEAGKHGFNVMIQLSNFDKEKEEEAILSFISSKVHSVICLSFNNQFSERVLKYKDKLLLVGQEHNELRYVQFNHYEVMKEMMLDLVETQKNYVFVGPDLEDPTITARRKAVVEVCYQKDVSLHFTWMDFDADNIIELKKKNVYICATDKIAQRIYSIAQSKDLVVGKDLFVTGVGDYDSSRLLIPRLTTIHFPNKTAGKMVVQMLHNKQNEKKLMTGKIIKGNSHC